MAGPKIVNLSDVISGDDKILSDETADCLRKWLKMAEDGELISVAMVGEHTAGEIVCGHSAAARGPKIIGGLELLKTDIIDKTNRG